jgi:hypothetical protein
MAPAMALIVVRSAIEFPLLIPMRCARLPGSLRRNYHDDRLFINNRQLQLGLKQGKTLMI